MTARPTNEFNALSLVSDKVQLRLWLNAMAGGNAVSNVFTETADAEGLTPEGRARKEREETRIFNEQMEHLHEQTVQFQEQLDRLQQATAEALRENEEQLEAARQELERIRERAYEITMPDGSVVKVYRDGDKVRAESGVEVSPDIVRPADLSDRSPTWSDWVQANGRVKTLTDEHAAIVAYGEKLQSARDAFRKGDLNADELAALEKNFGDTMPAGVRSDLVATSASGSLELGVQAGAAQRLSASFASASVSKDGTAVPELSEDDFKTLRPAPAASKPVPM